MPLAARKSDLSLKVNRIKQDKDMSCWYASAQMVLSYRSIAMSVTNMSTNLSALIRYLADEGLAKSAVLTFADEVGLHKDQAQFAKGFTEETYGIYLGKLGPLWMAGLFPQGGTLLLFVVSPGTKLWSRTPTDRRLFLSGCQYRS